MAPREWCVAERGNVTRADIERDAVGDAENHTVNLVAASDGEVYFMNSLRREALRVQPRFGTTSSYGSRGMTRRSQLLPRRLYDVI